MPNNINQNNMDLNQKEIDFNAKTLEEQLSYIKEITTDVLDYKDVYNKEPLQDVIYKYDNNGTEYIELVYENGTELFKINEVAENKEQANMYEIKARREIEQIFSEDKTLDISSYRLNSIKEELVLKTIEEHQDELTKEFIEAKLKEAGVAESALIITTLYPNEQIDTEELEKTAKDQKGTDDLKTSINSTKLDENIKVKEEISGNEKIDSHSNITINDMLGENYDSIKMVMTNTNRVLVCGVKDSKVSFINPNKLQVMYNDRSKNLAVLENSGNTKKENLVVGLRFQAHKNAFIGISRDNHNDTKAVYGISTEKELVARQVTPEYGDKSAMDRNREILGINKDNNKLIEEAQMRNAMVSKTETKSIEQKESIKDICERYAEEYNVNSDLLYSEVKERMSSADINGKVEKEVENAAIVLEEETTRDEIQNEEMQESYEREI